MIAAAYLVLTICKGIHCSSDLDQSQSIAAVSIPQPSMDQCIRQAKAFNTNRKDVRAMCVPGAKP